MMGLASIGSYFCCSRSEAVCRGNYIRKTRGGGGRTQAQEEEPENKGKRNETGGRTPLNAIHPDGWRNTAPAFP